MVSLTLVISVFYLVSIIGLLDRQLCVFSFNLWCTFIYRGQKLTCAIGGVIQMELAIIIGSVGNWCKEAGYPIQDRAGIDFLVGESAEGGGRTITAPRPKYDSVASHISARTT